MCVIAVSKPGVKQPTDEQIRNMFKSNPDGAGYMYAMNGKVYIHKGFMDVNDFIRAIHDEHFTEKDSVVYHFRISTQAGVCPTMTHPFPLTSKLEKCELLDLECAVGIAHNGIIRMTSDHSETRFSDTVFFITEYMTRLIRNSDDLTDPAVLTMIDHLTNSKWAIMEGLTGNVVTVGRFVNQDGILFSNESFKPRPKYTTIVPPLKWSVDDYELGYYGVAR